MEVDSRRLRSDVADIFARRSNHDGSDILARLQAKFRSASKEPNALKEIDVDEMPMHSNGNNSQNINKRRKKKKKSPTKKKGQSSQSQESKQEVESLTLTWEHSPCAHNTTLYKAVPYTRIPRDAEIKNFIESLRTNPQLKEELESNREEYELLNITGPDCGTQATPAGPVLHVKSIAICKAKQDLEDLQIFGQISITDYQKNTFYLFSCEPDQSHRVSSDSNLVFSHCPIAPVLGGKMKFSLRNLPGTPQVFKEDKVFSLEYSCKNDCEEDIYQEFPLEGGYYAKMVYNKIPRAALVRCVMFLEHNQPGCEEQFYKVHGSVKINNVVCVDRDNSSKSLYVKYGEGSFNQVSRTVFALPVGSPLKVEYKLYHGDIEFANDKYVVPTHYMQGGMEDEEYLPCKDEHYRLGMTIRWYLYDGFFDRRRQLKAYVKMRPMDYINVKWSTDFSQEYMQRTDNDLVEVFSILVGCVNSAPPVLCGRIVVRDAYGKVYIFARNKDLPDKYSSKKQRFERTVSVAWPDDRWITRKDFFMHLWLKDGNEKLLCKGYLSWQNGSRRFDRRLCDVITYGNEKGYYAVVHYSVFKNGKKATVSVKFNEKDGYSHVYGRVFAAYDNNDGYPSTYDKECYRSIIFNRSKEDCVPVDNRFEIPLSKTHVSAPSDCKKLIVDADLWVHRSTDTSFQNASAELHFEASRDGSQSKQVGCFVVTVSWSQ